MVAEVAEAAVQQSVSQVAPPVAPEVMQEMPRPFLWTTEEFHTAGETGVFEGRRVHLVEGVIIEVTVGIPHFISVMLTTKALEKAFGEGYVVRPQGPLDVNQRTDPKPDVAVVSGTIRDQLKLQAHPASALLVVEVSDSSLEHDRTVKASLYARAGITDYWIINLIDNCLEVRRDPQPMPAQPHGHGYLQASIHHKTQTVSPLAAPDAAIAVADLLP